MQSSQLKSIPPLIRKSQSNFIPSVKRPKTVTVEFRALVIGKHFKFAGVAEGVSAQELELVLEKIAPSAVERNAKVVKTTPLAGNPINQIWTIDGRCDVIEVNFP